MPRGSIINFKGLSARDREHLLMAFVNLDLARLSQVTQLLDWLEANPIASRADIDRRFSEFMQENTALSRTMRNAISDLLSRKQRGGPRLLPANDDRTG